MPKIGLTNFRYAVLTEASDGTVSYDGAKTPAHAISCDVSITNRDAKLYGDDVLIESDKGFQGGTVKLGLSEEDETFYNTALGHSATNGVTTRNAEDVAPYLGIGQIVTKRIGGVPSYKVEILKKVQFGEPGQSYKTKGENIEFGTYELEGAVFALANGDWSTTKTFTELSDAVDWLEAQLAAPSSGSGSSGSGSSGSGSSGSGSSGSGTP